MTGASKGPRWTLRVVALAAAGCLCGVAARAQVVARAGEVAEAQQMGADVADEMARLDQLWEEAAAALGQ